LKIFQSFFSIHLNASSRIGSPRGSGRRSFTQRAWPAVTMPSRHRFRAATAIFDSTLNVAAEHVDFTETQAKSGLAHESPFTTLRDAIHWRI